MDVSEPVRGSDISTCSVTLKKNRIDGKHKRNERGLISHSPVTWVVTLTSKRIGIDRMLYYNQLCGVNYYVHALYSVTYLSS